MHNERFPCQAGTLRGIHSVWEQHSPPRQLPAPVFRTPCRWAGGPGHCLRETLLLPATAQLCLVPLNLGS